MTGRFFHDLKRGSTAEELVVKLFTRAGIPSHADKSVRIPWDIKSEVKNQTVTTEVKLDEYERKSGNIAIEVYNSRLGRPSGITATEAFFWVHVLTDKVVWIARVDAIRHYMDETPPLKIVDRGGDGNATLHLYESCSILPDVFCRIDDIAPKKLKAHITKEWETHGNRI